jgi:hypothetical protein
VEVEFLGKDADIARDADDVAIILDQLIKTIQQLIVR